MHYFLLSNEVGHARSSTQTFNSMGDGGTLIPCKKLPQPDADHSPPFTADVNTLRTGDADLRFYVTTVQDG